MQQSTLELNVRKASNRASIIDIRGDINAAAERPLMEAYARASSGGVCAIILNFSQLSFMNSTGIGLLVSLLIRASRQKQKLLSYGLSDHYRQIFELTRLNEAIRICKDEQEVLAAAAA